MICGIEYLVGALRREAHKISKERNHVKRRKSDVWTDDLP
jgi:hypothetical protein